MRVEQIGHHLTVLAYPKNLSTVRVLNMQGITSGSQKQPFKNQVSITAPYYCKIKKNNLCLWLYARQASPLPASPVPSRPPPIQIKMISLISWHSSSPPLAFSLSTTEASEHVISYVWLKLCYWFFFLQRTITMEWQVNHFDLYRPSCLAVLSIAYAA